MNPYRAPVERPRRGPWQERAACLKADDNEKGVFITARIQPGNAEAREVRNKFCHPCPVRQQCAQWAAGEVMFAGVAAGYIWSSPHGGAGGRPPARPIPA